MIGQTLGPYRIDARLGAGGMGVVYRARDTKLGRDVAIKILPAEKTADAAARARLLEEARSASALNHPHICHVYEVDEAGDVIFIAMELVEGQPLAVMIPQGGMPAESVLLYGAQLAGALAHAHARRVLHRDLKSANIIVTPEGRAKILDFGLAERLQKKELEDATRSQVQPSVPGLISGTLSYLAPEVLRGEPSSEASDVWALGVVLYEMASGALPFGGRTGYELTSAILRESPPPLPAQMPPGVRSVILRCLAKEPGQRYQRAGEVQAALEAISSSSETIPSAATAAAESPGRPFWKRPLPLGLGAAALALAALVIWKGPLLISIGKTELPSAATTGQAPAASGPVGVAFQVLHPSSNPEANELLQRALMFTRFQLDPLRARQMLERALQLDPKFTEARVNYALTFVVAVEAGISNDPSDIYRAEQELRRALQEDPSVSRAHALMGAVHFYQGRNDLAVAESEKSIQLAPNDLAGRMWSMIFGRLGGNHAESVRIGRQLIATEPLFWPPRYHISEALREQGNIPDAIREVAAILEQDQQNVIALRCLARAYIDSGEFSKARATLERAPHKDRGNFRVRLTQALLHAAEGQRAAALKELDDGLLKYADLQPFSTLEVTEIYAMLGEKTKALEWMDRSMRKGDERAEWLRRDPLLANIRNEPRFKQILDSIEFRRQQRQSASEKK